jgi:hypothetical protein
MLKLDCLPRQGWRVHPLEHPLEELVPGYSAIHIRVQPCKEILKLILFIATLAKALKEFILRQEPVLVEVDAIKLPRVRDTTFYSREIECQQIRGSSKSMHMAKLFAAAIFRGFNIPRARFSHEGPLGPYLFFGRLPSISV